MGQNCFYSPGHHRLGKIQTWVTCVLWWDDQTAWLKLLLEKQSDLRVGDIEVLLYLYIWILHLPSTSFFCVLCLCEAVWNQQCCREAAPCHLSSSWGQNLRPRDVKQCKSQKCFLRRCLWDIKNLLMHL